MPANPLNSPDLNREGQFPEAVIQAARAHPGLTAAMRRAIHGALMFADSEQNLKLHMNDVGRWFLGLLALYLDASGGLTHRRLRELSGRTGLISAGRATAMLWQLQRIGYIVPVAAMEPGKRRDYVLTPLMFDAFRERLRIDYGAMTLIAPDTAPLMARFDEPRVLNAVYQFFGGDILGAALNPREDVAPLSTMSARNAGLLILFHLVAEADDGRAFPPVGPVAVSVSRIAARFSVSRSHVVRVLREAEQLGLIRRAGEGEAVLEPAFAEMLKTFYAALYTGFASTARRAQALLDEAAPLEQAEAAE